ncbi:MAG: PQQ-like beta-propeller repeat protein [Candidatus Nitrohelix vancouverensis]|uniref:PQQ-like beta-propeller repeat protein n=1 Tax=Candidatus Nitrohelix vancouverensis TaxID=2705534 RepID=A0A7T0C2C6_9BACT|nr:MAG: PQQ-like beta-propeller repeat protein [Candidatus Nitrohelix vancouverensis]
MASHFVWNPDSKKGRENFKLETFAWFYDEFHLVIEGRNANDLREIAVSVTGGDKLSDMQSSGKQWELNGWTKLAWLCLLCFALLTLLLGPICLFAAMMPDRREDLIEEKNHPRFYRFCFYTILALSFYEAYWVVSHVYRPGFSYCNNAWTIFDMPRAEPAENPLIPFYNYAPGRPVFYSLIFRFLRIFGYSLEDPFYTEVAYRIVQFVIVTGANIALYFFLIHIFIKNQLPGVHFFPLIAFAFLSLDPELVFTYLSGNVHTSLFFPIFIGFFILSYRLAFEDQGWKTLMLFGLLGTCALLWRNDLKLVPILFLTLVFLCMGINKRSLKKTLIAFAITYFIPVLIMSNNYHQHQKFALYDGSQMSIVPITNFGAGNPDNSLGIMFDDCHVSRLGYFLNDSARPQAQSNYPEMQKFLAGYVATHPIEFFTAWKNRLPLNAFSLPSQVRPGSCQKIQERVLDFIKPDHIQYLWALMSFSLLFLPFAVLGDRRLMIFVLAPVIYALVLIGAAGSGVGYFIYIYLSFTIVITLGLSSLFKILRSFYSKLLFKSEGHANQRKPLESPHSKSIQILTLTTSVLVCIVLLLGIKGYDPYSYGSKNPQLLNQQDRLKRIFTGNDYNDSIQIKWRMHIPAGTQPYSDGHLVPFGANILFNRYLDLAVVNPDTGVIEKNIPYRKGPGCIAGYFQLKKDKLVIAELDPKGHQRVRTINADTLETINEGPLKYHIYSPFIVDDQNIYHSTHVWRTDYQFTAQQIPKDLMDDTAADQPVLLYNNKQSSLGGIAQTVDSVFVPTMHDGLFLAFDKNTWNLKWKFKGRSNAHATPVIYENTVVYADKKGVIYQLDLNDGKLIQTIDTQMEIFEGIAIAGGVLYAVSWDEIISAADLNTGKLLWRLQGRGAMKARPLFKDGALYTGSGTWLMKIDAKTGKKLWEINLGTFIIDTPLIQSDVIVVRTLYGLYGLQQLK